MTPLRDADMYAEFEKKPATEDADIAQIARGILITQKQNAQAQNKPLERGTHAKGVAVGAEFEVLDLKAEDRGAALTARLAQGIYAHPGVYPAIVRFANAASQEYADAQPDLRAMSFQVDVPAGVVGPEAQRLDFSMQTATVFPINDVHAFAVLLRVLSAVGKWGKVKALWALSLRDLASFFQAALAGVRQKRATPRLAYQQLRYWSTVPFRHGKGDAIKYSATASANNPGQVDWNDPNGLKEDLIRHVNQDERMSEFDFGIQFLDTEQMTRLGRRHGADFWIENASVEWNEEQAPFHTVARLRLKPKSVLTAEETARQHIDVTTYSLPESRPLGGINRARWAAEHLSLVAREGGDVDIPPAATVRRPLVFSLLRWAAVAVLLVLAATLPATLLYRWYARDNVPPLEHVDVVRYLDQGWGTDVDSPRRELYYYTPQGAPLLGIRYSWLLHLERPFRSGRVVDADHMRQLDFIVDQIPTRSNPDLLPVGLTRHYDGGLQDYVVDVTCAACHTGQLNVTRTVKSAPNQPAKRVTTAIRIDGGQAMIAFTDAKVGSFLVEVLAGLFNTTVNPLKFNRFANGVLGADASLSNKFRLWRALAGVTADGFGRALGGSFNPHWYPTQEGYGRTDAIARISNVVFGDHMSPANYRVARGPASYPYLWNIWKFDWEQYGAFVAQPMARNIGESLGTGAEYTLVDQYGRPAPQAERYRTSFSFENAERIESALQTLRPPEWPEDLLGKVDLGKAEKGRQLFLKRCVFCHGPKAAIPPVVREVAPGRLDAQPPLPLWQIQAKPLAEMGTDPEAAMDLAKFRLDATATGLELAEVQRLLRHELEQQLARAKALIPDIQQHLAQLTAQANALPKGSAEREALEKQVESIAGSDLKDALSGPDTVSQQLEALKKLDLRSVSIGEGLNILGLAIKERYYAENHYSAQAQACFNGFGMLDIPEANLGYKPRPLEGVWATPPFLHNGSVPSIYYLLSPAADRPRHFYLGRREYDPAHLGYVTPVDAADGPPAAEGKAASAAVRPRKGEFRFDTTVRGNSNAGHEFNQNYVEWDPSKPPEAQYQNGLIGPRLQEEEKWALIEYLKIHRDDLDIIQYLKPHNGSYPPPEVPNVPNCSALLDKRQ